MKKPVRPDPHSVEGLRVPRGTRIDPWPGRGRHRLAARDLVPAVALLFAAVVWLATWPPGFAVDLFEQGQWLGPASDNF